MADPFFLEEMLSMSQSAFVPYSKPMEGFGLKNSIMDSNGRNMNKRVIEFLNSTNIYKCRDFENDPRFRHKINERLRRAKEKKSYSALHSMLPPRTKIDKNSIIQTTALYLLELKKLKEKLKKRNQEIEGKLSTREGEKADVAKIGLRVNSPSSSIDSMVEVLRCLKSMGMKLRKIESGFSVEEFSSIMEIETKIGAEVIEKGLQSALAEVETSFVCDFSSTSKEW